MKNLFQFHIRVITFDDLCARLQRTDDLTNPFQFFRTDFRSFVQQNDVTEFCLLDNQILDIFLSDVRAGKVIAAGKFILQTQGIHDSYDAVETADAVFGISPSQSGNGTDCIGNRFRLTDTAGFDDDIVETLLLHEFQNLLDQVSLQRTADTAVLQGDETFVFFAYDAPFLNQVGINVYFTDIVDNNRKADSLLVGKDMVYQSCFSTAQITGQEQYGYFFCIHCSWIINAAKLRFIFQCVHFRVLLVREAGRKMIIMVKSFAGASDFCTFARCKQRNIINLKT